MPIALFFYVASLSLLIPGNPLPFEFSTTITAGHEQHHEQHQDQHPSQEQHHASLISRQHPTPEGIDPHTIDKYPPESIEEYRPDPGQNPTQVSPPPTPPDRRDRNPRRRYPEPPRPDVSTPSWGGLMGRWLGEPSESEYGVVNLS